MLKENENDKKKKKRMVENEGNIKNNK